LLKVKTGRGKRSRKRKFRGGKRKGVYIRKRGEKVGWWKKMCRKKWGKMKGRGSMSMGR